MTTTVDPRAETVEAPAVHAGALDRAAGVELLGDVHGSGYKAGAALVRRADGQMVQLGPLMYALLDCVDGRRDLTQLASCLSDQLGRTFDEAHVRRLAEKLSAQGLLAGTEQHAPPRRNPLLALRWKVLVTNPVWTRRITAPFTFLFRPWIVWPVVACFVAVLWFVLVDKGVASATSQAFGDPALLLLVFALTIASAAFHEFGHACATRYGGGTPGGMGMGIYMVWPAFYTDVTDAYRLPRRDRLRVDLGGLYFNAVAAVVTLGAWLAWRQDALLLVIALQLLMMLKNLSPVIRSDGYHILADTTGIPDLYAHIGPTLRRLLPGHRNEPSALRGRARLLVTLWVLIVVPVLLSLMFAAVILLPRLMTSAWDSGRSIADGIPHDSTLTAAAAGLRLFALFLPVLGSLLVSQKIVRMYVGRARSWSAGSPPRRAAAVLVGVGALAGLAWAWWPGGQYQPVRPTDRGTIVGFGHLLSAPASVARPQPAFRLAPGKHLAVAMIPVGGATKQHPAYFFVPASHGDPAAALLSYRSPDPSSTTTTSPMPVTAFPFKLPSAPAPGGNQALAVGTRSGGVTYDIAYSLVTVSGGAPVTNQNTAYALASCNGCTTVAVSFQVVLVIGQSNVIAPTNAAGALNVNCPACTTVAIADQIVVTLTKQPPQALVDKIQASLRQLNEISALGSPQQIAAAVTAVQQEIEDELNASGLLSNTTPSTTTRATTASSGTSPPATTSAGQTTSTTPSTTTTTAGSTTTAPATTSPATSPTTTTTTPSTTTETTTPTTTAATTTAATTTTAG